MPGVPDARRPPKTLAAKLGAIGALLLLLALGSIGLTLWVTWQLEGGAAAVNEAGRLRMQTWRLAQGVALAEPARVHAQVAEFDSSLALLERGDPARPLFVPHDAATLAAFALVQRHWAELRTRWLAPAQMAQPAQTAPVAPAEAAAQAEALVGEIDAFVQAIESQLSRLTAVLAMFQFGLMALAIAGGVAMLYAAYLFVFNPLARIQEGLARLERGDLAARVAVESGDEFGRVADGFNRMASTLEDFYRTLERKVQDKTERLRAERERLAVLYEASAFVSQASTLDALAQGFARRLREAGRADAALLRWHDAARGQQLLLASDCVPEEMLQSEACLRPGDCHCAAAGAADSADLANSGGARVIAILPQGAGGRAASQSCARFGFEHVLVVPVRLHDKLLGEADLLYRGEPRALAHEDRELLEGWPRTWPPAWRACAPRRSSARPRWPTSAACWRASCTTRSPRAWRS